jgi:hypothetical protein
MSVSSLTLEEFQSLLDRFGGDLNSWPELYRLSASTFITESVEAQELMRRAEAVETGLRNPPKAPSGLSDRVVAEALRRSPIRKN